IKLEGQAIQLCQSKLNEVTSGVVALSSQSGVPFDEDPDWTWSVEAQQSNISGLWSVQVTVSRPRPDGSKTECKLTQLLLDPSLRGSTLTPVQGPTVSKTTTTSGSGSTSGSGGATGGAGGATGGAAGGGATGVGKIGGGFSKGS